MWYMAYRDVSADTMLKAVPGQSYNMAAVDDGLPIPPTDGRWDTTGTPLAITSAPDAALPAPEPADSAPPAPAPEGGD